MMRAADLGLTTREGLVLEAIDSLHNEHDADGSSFTAADVAGTTSRIGRAQQVAATLAALKRKGYVDRIRENGRWRWFILDSTPKED